MAGFDGCGLTGGMPSCLCARALPGPPLLLPLLLPRRMEVSASARTAGERHTTAAVEGEEWASSTW